MCEKCGLSTAVFQIINNKEVRLDQLERLGVTMEELRIKLNEKGLNFTIKDYGDDDDSSATYLDLTVLDNDDD